MMQEHTLFPVRVWTDKLWLDTDRLETVVRDFSGKNFYDEEFIDTIQQSIPEPFSNSSNAYKRYDGEYDIQSWVNITPKGGSIKQHINATNSFSVTNVLLSGIYHVKAPENSGQIIFHDPKGTWFCMVGDYNSYPPKEPNCLTPIDNMLILFPSWLEHEVGVNDSDEDRITISFNILLPPQN